MAGTAPTPDRYPDELLTMTTTVVNAVHDLTLSAYTKGMRDGLEATAQMTQAAVDAAKGTPLEDTGWPKVLETIRDSIRILAFEIPAPPRLTEGQA